MRVLIADDGSKVRFALQVLLDCQPGLEVVGEAICAEDLLAQVKATRPDLVLLGWELSGLDALGSVSTLREACAHLMVIALSGRPEAREAALQAGADAFVSKTAHPEHLLAAIQVCSREKHTTEDNFIVPVRPDQEEKKQ
jgi:DNA-binding NarL/FixJ family response regulator